MPLDRAILRSLEGSDFQYLFEAAMGSALPATRVYFSQRIIRGLDRVGRWLGRKSSLPAHLRVGRAGEEAAFFHLRGLGYTIVARNWRTRRLRGDLDLIGWDNGTLCFIEVKTRSQREMVPAEFAIDTAKQNMLRRMARAWLRGWLLKEPTGGRVRKRFDAVSVYLTGGQPEIEVRRGAFAWHTPSAEKPWQRKNSSNW